MKKIILSIVLIISLFSTIVIPTIAETALPTIPETGNDTTVIFFEDGSKLTVSLTIDEQSYSRAASAKSSVIYGKKEATFENSDGEVEWIYTSSATFSYTSGVSSTCTDASYTQTIYKGNWTFSNGAATKSGNTARGVGNYIKKVLFITVKDIDIDLTLTCDKYGNIT